MRSWPGGPPNGTTVGKVLKISAEQNGKQLPVEINYDRQVWSGLSWGAGEIRRRDFASTGSIVIRCSSAEKRQSDARRSSLRRAVLRQVFCSSDVFAVPNRVRVVEKTRYGIIVRNP